MHRPTITFPPGQSFAQCLVTQTAWLLMSAAIHPLMKLALQRSPHLFGEQLNLGNSTEKPHEDAQFRRILTHSKKKEATYLLLQVN